MAGPARGPGGVRRRRGRPARRRRAERRARQHAKSYFDERLYLRYADGIARHGAYTIDGVDPSAWRPPGYPMLLGVLRWLGAGIVGLRLAGVVLLALSVLGVHALGRRIFGPAAGALAAVLTAAYPLLVYTAASLYPQVQALALLVGALLAALAALEARGRRR